MSAPPPTASARHAKAARAGWPRASTWGAAEVAYLEAHVADRTHSQIAAALGRTTTAVRAYSFRHGLTSRRRWTADELGHVRARAFLDSAETIGRALGRTARAVRLAVERLGLSRRRAPLGEPFAAHVRCCHALGWSDAETAESWAGRHPGRSPTDRHTASLYRRRLGLPDNALSEHRRRKVAARTAEQLRAAGLPSIGHLRAEAFRRRAREAGWPEDLRPRAVQILNALWDRGPMTRREIAATIGMPWKGSRASLASNDPEGSYLAHLSARGLVVVFKRAKRVTGEGKGRSVDVYSLPLTIERRKVNTDGQGNQQGERRFHDRGTAGLDGADPAGGDRRDPPGRLEGDLRQTG